MIICVKAYCKLTKTKRSLINKEIHARFSFEHPGTLRE